MKNLHPIAAKLGYKTNKDFYNDYPTKESYEMAMGGSPYVGQPTYDQFLSFGPPTKQVPFYDYGGNVDLFLKETKKSLMPAAKAGMQTKGNTPTSTNDFLDQRNNYTLGFIKDNFQRGIVNEVDNEIRKEFMRYGGLPKAQGGNQGQIDQAFQKAHDRNVQMTPIKPLPAKQVPTSPDLDLSNRNIIRQDSGTFKRDIEEDILSGQEKANLIMGSASGITNFIKGPQYIKAEENMRIKRLPEYVFGTGPGEGQGWQTDGAMFTGPNYAPNKGTYSRFTGQGLYSGEYGGSPNGDQFGGMIQYDTEGSQVLPVALSGLQVKMNPGLGNSTYNANQLAWPFHPDVMSAPPIRSRRNLTSVPRKEANVEAEGGETVVTNFSDDAIPEHYNIKGPRHTHGGVPLSLPEDSFIFSDTAKMKIKDPEILKQFGMSPKKGGYTPAEIAKKYDINKYKKILMDPDSDETQISTAEKMIADCNIKLAKLALIQESMKGFPQGIPEIAKPYLAQLNIDPNMFFGQGQPETQAQETEETPEQEGMESQPDEEQMAYGGIPMALNGLSIYAKNPYFKNILKGREDEYNQKKLLEEYNKYYGNSNAKVSDYIPLNYNDGYNIPRIPGAGRNFSYEFSSNDPSVKSPDFLKGTNINSLKLDQRDPSAIGSLFKPRKTTIEIGFGPQGAASKPGTQTNATPGTQINTQPSAQPSTQKQVSPQERQQQILNAANPFGSYNTSQGSYFYPKAPVGQGVNQGLYPPYETAPNFEYGGFPIAQNGKQQKNIPAKVEPSYFEKIRKEQPYGAYGSQFMMDPEMLQDVMNLIPFIGPDATAGEAFTSAFNLPLKTVTKGITGTYDLPGNIYQREVDPNSFWAPAAMNTLADPLTYAGGKLIGAGIKGSAMLASLAAEYGPKVYKMTADALRALATKKGLIKAATNVAPSLIGNVVRQAELNKKQKESRMKNFYEDMKAPASTTKVTKPVVPQEVKEKIDSTNLTEIPGF